MDLISREDAIKTIKEYFKEKFDDVYGDRDEVAAGEIDFILKYNKELNGRIEKLQTVEARPVVHGEWIEEKGVLDWFYSCSECNSLSEYKTNFCKTCGADMRKKVQE